MSRFSRVYFKFEIPIEGRLTLQGWFDSLRGWKGLANAYQHPPKEQESDAPIQTLNCSVVNKRE